MTLAAGHESMISMHDAASNGDIAELERLLAAGADINGQQDLAVDGGKYWQQLTPLMVAACSQSGATVDTVRWLVEHGANPDITSAAGVTATWYAAGNGRWPVNRAMAETSASENHGADPAARLQFLLNQGNGLAAIDHYGTRLLVAACTVGDPARVQLLLEWGADVHPPQREPSPAEQRYPPNPWASQPWTFQIPLFCAVESGSADCVQLLLNAGADINIRNPTGDTPIMQAPNVVIFRLLLTAGADPDAVDNVGKDAFQQFVSLPVEVSPPDMRENLRQLVDLGMDVDAILQHDTWTRLFSAAFELNDVAVERLLALGANPHLGRPPISGFCWHYNSSYSKNIARGIRLLAAAGCDVNQPDAAGDTLLHNASLGYSHALNAACFNSSSDGCNYTAVRTLLELGAAPDPVGTRGYTPLMNGVEDSCPPAVEALLAAGADPHCQNEKGATAIDMARSTCARCDGYENSPEAYEQAMYKNAIACLHLVAGLA
jgi:ankyrin repeat protein